MFLINGGVATGATLAGLAIGTVAGLAVAAALNGGTGLCEGKR